VVIKIFYCQIFWMHGAKETKKIFENELHI